MGTRLASQRNASTSDADEVQCEANAFTSLGNPSTCGPEDLTCDGNPFGSLAYVLAGDADDVTRRQDRVR
jgi:hypothetical protein